MADLLLRFALLFAGCFGESQKLLAVMAVDAVWTRSGNMPAWALAVGEAARTA